MGDISWECPEGHGYHIKAESVLVEFVKDNEEASPGEQGDIVLTNFHSFAMPFIRYKIGDVGTPSDEQCSCGRTLPIMHSVIGRSNDFIILRDGTRLFPHRFLSSRILDGISQCRIIQEDYDLLRILVKLEDSTSRFYKSSSGGAKRLILIFGDEVDTQDIEQNNRVKLHFASEKGG